VSTVESNERRSGGGILLAILALLVGLAAGGVIGIFGVGPMMAQRMTAARLATVSSGEAGGSTPVETPAEIPPTHPGVIYELENLIVNPAGSQGTRFLVTTLAVELDTEEIASALEEREAAARDAVIDLLGSKTVVELSDIGIRDSLRAELAEALRKVIGVGGVRRIYLPQYVIQ